MFVTVDSKINRLLAYSKFTIVDKLAFDIEIWHKKNKSGRSVSCMATFVLNKLLVTFLNYSIPAFL